MEFLCDEARRYLQVSPLRVHRSQDIGLRLHFAFALEHARQDFWRESVYLARFMNDHKNSLSARTASQIGKELVVWEIMAQNVLQV